MKTDRTGDLPASGGGARPWLAVGSIALGTFAVVTSEFLPIGLLEPIAADMQVSVGMAGLIVTVPGITAAVAAPAITLLAKSVDRRLLLICFSLLVLLSNLSVALSSTFSAMLFGRVLLGISVGGFWTFAAAAGRRLVLEAQGGRATALVLAGISVGTVVGVPIGTGLGAVAGWRFAFAAVSALAFVVAVGQLLLLSRLPGRHVVTWGSLAGLFRVRAIVVGFAAMALLASGHFAAYTFLGPFLSQIVRLDAAQTSWILAGYGVAGVVGTFLGERATSRDLRMAFFGVAAAMCLALSVAVAVEASTLLAVLAILVWGMAFGAVPVCAQIWIYRASPDNFETSSALMVTVFQLAIAAGSLSGGLVVDKFGIRPALFVGVVLSAACFAWLIPARAPRA